MCGHFEKPGHPGEAAQVAHVDHHAPERVVVAAVVVEHGVGGRRQDGFAVAVGVGLA